MIVRIWISIIVIVLLGLKERSRAAPNRSSILNRPACQGFNQIVSQQWQELNNLYKKADSRFTVIELENSPYFISNSDSDIVILLHGFLGSPFEMNRMADSLKNKGYSVLNDLIPGYGFSARVANQFTENYWNQYFARRYEAVFQCYKHVHLIGFSTGGLIFHKFLIANPKLRATVPLNVLYLSSMGLKELKIMIRYPDNYLRDAPYLNMNEIAKSGQEVIDFKNLEKNQSPVIVYATSKDLVMDFETTIKMVTRDFSNLVIVNYSNTLAPHHLFRPEVSDVSFDFEKKLLGFF